MIQPDLFTATLCETVAPPRQTVRERAGRRVVAQLQKLRRTLSDDEKEFDEYLAKAVREIKAAASLNDTRRIELILNCVESSHAHTLGEIAEDCQLAEQTVRGLIRGLIESGQIMERERLVIGGSVKQVLYLSNRKPCACV